MAKSKIVIIDKDINYAFSLQIKFIEELNDKVDIEIITDESYFREFFFTPQEIDVLVISEELYDKTIERHSIKNIFVLTEKNENVCLEELKYNVIFKYSSLVEIYNVIVGKSEELLYGINDKNNEAKVILLTSASGGVGKTSISMGICASIAKQYKRVLYINAERMQTFQSNLENKLPINSDDVYAKLLINKEEPYRVVKPEIRTEMFEYIPAFKKTLLSMGLGYDIFRKIILNAKRKPVILIILLWTQIIHLMKKRLC